jgi:hypothetical protein
MRGRDIEGGVIRGGEGWYGVRQGGSEFVAFEDKIIRSAR